jgi:alpha-mannosidase
MSSAGLANPEIPQIRIASPKQFFDHVKASTKGKNGLPGDELPVWRGELYFELHRGVSLRWDTGVSWSMLN